MIGDWRKGLRHCDREREGVRALRACVMGNWGSEHGPQVCGGDTGGAESPGMLRASMCTLRERACVRGSVCVGSPVRVEPALAGSPECGGLSVFQ